MGQLIPKDKISSYVGFQTEPTEWFKVEQSQINAFADATLDHQFIHVDAEKAAKTPFGSTIAHGFLSLSMLSHFAESFSVGIEGVKMGINYGFDKVRFLTPVKVNSEIRALAKIDTIIEKSPGKFMITFRVTVEIKGEEKPALMAQWLTMQIVD
jgi:acyl dehydratase